VGLFLRSRKNEFPPKSVLSPGGRRTAPQYL
jgi:hypothetical protein